MGIIYSETEGLDVLTVYAFQQRDLIVCLHAITREPSKSISVIEELISFL